MRVSIVVALLVALSRTQSREARKNAAISRNTVVVDTKNLLLTLLYLCPQWH